MKITCQSCQSKYNVADDKVQGKIVKIRCRKCGATIVVNGTGGAATNGAPATENGAAGGEAQWHVNVTDTDQRTMSLAELIDSYNAGVVTQETFIWTDGMDDWKPLAEVEPVVSALHASANQVAVGTPGAFETPGGYEPPQAEAPAYEPPAPEYEAPAAFAAPEPKRAAVQRREARGRDLFATNAGEEVQTSAPVVTSGMAAAGSAPAGSDGLTGQRNENSVLFSLAVLTKDADERPAAQESRTTSNKEDSGLIDLKALAARAESMNSGSATADVFSAPIGLAPSPLGAPLGALGSMAPEAPKSKLPLMIGGAAGVVVLLVLGVVLGMKLAGSPAVPAASALPVASTLPATTATVDPSATASAAASVDTSASAAPSASVAAAKIAKGGGGGGGGGGGARPAPGPKPAGGGAAPGPAPGPAPAPAPKKGGDCGCNGDLMCLMKCSTH